jgi:hypothetical protein
MQHPNCCGFAIQKEAVIMFCSAKLGSGHGPSGLRDRGIV